MPFSMSSKAMGFIKFLSDVRYQILKQREDLFANHRQHCGKQVLKDKLSSERTCHWGLWGSKIHWDKNFLLYADLDLCSFVFLCMRTCIRACVRVTFYILNVKIPTLAESLLVNSKHFWPNGSITVSSAQILWRHCIHRM